MSQAISPPARALRLCFSVLLGIGVAACDHAAPAADAVPEPGVVEATRNGPEGAPPGSCWGRTVSPAVFETVTEQVQVEPAKVNPDGSVAKPPVYRSETHQEMVVARRDNWFETPCPEVLTPEFVATLQRALSARGLYTQEITGTLDDATRAAVQTYQQPAGPDSGVLSLDAARGLGLIAVERDPA
ncbi:peptidoglycan-binding protein [Sulfitobacter sp. EhC04]|uniref:peptidoglycan-binding domain-containing protein n=1 Tax=Sulfitobacter sp. EhC04 TaxID=1849168 RepID=UPI0007F398D2|nr:peptidoglycan-binding domain-containing protein [Sulfitobacter sp. EhC04]OAN79876.1 peptidoglycan-binding protein [Sulfitobacter sp. EhC04]